MHLSLTPDPSVLLVSFATAANFTCSDSVVGGSMDSPNACTCQYRAKGAAKYKTSTRSVSYTYTEGAWVGRLHRTLLTGLEPLQRYEYTCDGEKHSFTFRSPPLAGHFPVQIAAVADLGMDCDSEGCGNSTITALGKAAENGSVDLLLHAGDIAYTSGNQQVWDKYMREMEGAAARVPYQICVGNHESHYNFSAVRSRFAMSGTTESQDGPQGPLPVNNLWHSFSYGGVQVVAFSTEHNHSIDSPQVTWLRSELEMATTPERRRLAPWIIVMAHKPMYCSTDDFYDCHIGGPMKIAPAIEPLLAEFGVDLFIAGHLHNYERSWPVLNRTVLRHDYAYNGTGIKGTTHVVIGNAGDNEGLTDSWSKPVPAWSAKRLAELGWARITAQNETTLLFEALHSSSGNVLDSFTLQKPAATSSASIGVATGAGHTSVASS